MNRADVYSISHTLVCLLVFHHYDLFGLVVSQLLYQFKNERSH